MTFLTAALWCHWGAPRRGRRPFAPKGQIRSGCRGFIEEVDKFSSVNYISIKCEYKRTHEHLVRYKMGRGPNITTARVLHCLSSTGGRSSCLGLHHGRRKGGYSYTMNV